MLFGRMVEFGSYVTMDLPSSLRTCMSRVKGFLLMWVLLTT